MAINAAVSPLSLENGLIQCLRAANAGSSSINSHLLWTLYSMYRSTCQAVLFALPIFDIKAAGQDCVSTTGEGEPGLL
ncbi:C6 zinc finger domain-containing protein [Metarhizium robertsii ARSEF 23]|uniref:C6 zinc finger domain-containing protein n=1 Tax=Metarhizium robertsii (strain ARSEF 23 / ATCC MYA-3075) TaxID=655844 RepID=A0A0B2XGF7_METRA|nr:C6 zinc finger domain-containing protein [Metarhizium robertsii ARSEF 23]KHO11079.1 C6 zinc finger domain-containing protein [Metarhizium robertsii ARSEF 23]